ncbi:cytokinesis protein [Diplodia corticola]|uniref:Cytokinesis protein n=1 Tax=Diplodia corticola TaxID=236234 RepID=A0A1J9S075_9PEZI|nr:cytokinesis protein [Diplodia corticola]OJD33085.1 cytokinesis protein [Diplodia corticola]
MSDETRPHWPVRQCSASADPVTRDRRIKRLETFIDKAKQRKTTYREPLRKPSGGSSIRRVRTAPGLVRRRSSTLLWLARPRSRDSHTPRDSSAESLLRRVGHHIKPRAQSQDVLPEKTPSEESVGSLCSAPEVLGARSSSSSPATSDASAVSSSSQNQLHRCCTPSLHLCTYRRSSSTRANASSSSDHDSPSSSSAASVKSACADTAITLTDVHVVKVPSGEGNRRLTPGQAAPSPSMHLIESAHGSYHVLWDEPPSHHLDSSDVDSTSVSPEENASQTEPPTGLDRVNTKLEEWSFAARECTALDKSRSHPHFQPYVEVYQDDYDSVFAMEDDSNALFMAPPNSKDDTPGSSALASRRGSETETECAGRASPSYGGRLHSDSSSPSSDETSPRQQHGDDVFDALAVPHQLRVNDDLLLTGGYYSPRPNKLLAPSDSLREQARSASSLSNTSDMSDNATSLLANHRDSVVLMSERTPDEFPMSNQWSHRDSVALAKDRMKKKHAKETGEAYVSGVGILKGVRKGDVERTTPLAIPRVQQVTTLMGVLSPIVDVSPPNVRTMDESHERRIDDMAERV